MDPYLVFKSTEDSEARRFRLRQGETRIGRGPENDIVLRDRTVSRSQCAVIRDGDAVWLVDAADHNRTRVNGVPGNAQLEDGAVLRFGRVELLFRDAAANRPRAEHQAKSRAGGRWVVVSTLAFVVVIALVALTAPWWNGVESEVAQTRENDAADPRQNDSSARKSAARQPSRATPPAGGSTGRAAGNANAVAAASKSSSPSSARDSESRAGGSPAARRERSPRGPAEHEADEAAQARAATALTPKAPASILPPAAESPRPDAPAPASEPAREARSPSRAESVASGGASSTPESVQSSDAFFVAHVVPFISKHCVSCHGAEKQKGDLALHVYRDATTAMADRDVWGEVARKLRSGDMPPGRRRRPSASELKPVLDWIDGSVFGANEGERDPGRVTMRRLNNYELNYTTRDLLGLDLKPGDAFPADEIGYGFDNIGDVLSLPPLLMEKYLSMARELVTAVWEEKDARKRIVVCSPEKRTEWRKCAREIFERFMTRAYRRPPQRLELSRLLRVFNEVAKKSGEFETGIRVGLQAILVSPHFLFRVELDSKPDDPAAVHPVNQYELASRLSYFLWSSMPDEQLFELAEREELTNPGVLAAQVRRMVQDRRSRGLIKTFSALWLGSREMKNVSPDDKNFPDFDEGLRRSMRKETEYFFQEVMRKDLSVLTFLDADFTFLDERLAKHYDIDGVKGSDHRRVKLEDRRRGGVLTQASMLTVTSDPSRTSPVKRGKWILEQILGAPPPPPPPGVDSLAEEGAVGSNLTLRQMMEKHRADPNCGVCHEKMDALGVALENFDGIGRWREAENGLPIDAAGVLPDGRSFKNIVELKGVLMEQKDAFVRCLCEKMLTFALGRGLEYTDMAVVDRIAASVKDNGYRFSALVIGIVESEPFRMRRGESRIEAPQENASSSR